MKEKIYTIPITEIFEEPCFCPFCALEKRLNEEEVLYALGPAMMEIDYRGLTNEKGFCLSHMKELNALPKILPLALVHQSGTDRLKELSALPPIGKKKLFSKEKDALDLYIEKLESYGSSCVICDRIKSNVDRYFDTFVSMMAENEDFFEKVTATDGFCIPHYVKAVKHAKKNLHGKKLEACVTALYETEKKKIDFYKTDLNAFVDSFDYKNAGKPCPVPGDTVLKTSFLTNGEFEPMKKSLKDV